MAEAGTRRYPQQLTNHLRELSQEKNDELLIYREWTFSHTEDTGAASSQCPCGKTGIRYLCYIDNQITRSMTFVGTSCAEFFDEEMKEVFQLTLGLISKGINGKYKGVQSRGEKKRFEVRANSNIVLKQSRLHALFRFVPIYQRGDGKWEIQAFTQHNNLTLNESYAMKIKSSRWSKDYGKGVVTGITFRVIQLERIKH